MKSVEKKAGGRPQGKPRVARAKAISPARSVAFEILQLVGEGKGNSDDLLHGQRMSELSVEDRNLVTALVLGVLRWQLALDARVRDLLQRPDQRLADAVLIALRLGIFQLLHMDRIPAHAALNESVELCRASGHAHAAGMVNAILRRIASGPRVGRRIYESPAAFAERLGHPLWLVERWVGAYGREAALTICEADQKEPGEPVLFAAEEGVALPQMDDGSRLVAELAAAAVPEARRVWDACAAPGGKTLILAHRLRGVEILATDVSSQRLVRMRSRLGEYGYAANVRCEVADAADLAADAGVFDLILCDVPCSGTGTLARNPEIRHRLAPADMQRHAARQRKILRGALKRLAPGGRLLYSTCSLEAEECEQVVQSVGGEMPIRTLPIEAILKQLAAGGIVREPLEGVVCGDFLRTLPGVHPGDGFFAALLTRD